MSQNGTFHAGLLLVGFAINHAMRAHLWYFQPFVLACLAALFWPPPLCGQQDTPAERPIICVHVNSTFVQALYGKSRKETLAILGWPYYEQKEGPMYVAKAPGSWGEVEGYLIVYFAGDKARGFQLNTKAPLDSTFVRLVLQNSPGARFEPWYAPSNLTGQNWEDKHAGFFAATTQMSEHEYLLTIDLTPPNERTVSPLWRKRHGDD